MAKRRRGGGGGRGVALSAVRALVPVLALAAAPVRRPLRFIAATALLGVLMAIVAVTALPYAVVRRNPDLALWLSPGHPTGHLAKAERLRDELITLVRAEAGADAPAEPPRAAGPETADTIGSLPTAAERTAADAAVRAERTRLAEAIRDHALAVLRVEPLNATAMRLLGEVADGPEASRALMKAAVRHSRREAIALVWLLNDSIVQGDAAEALAYADTLLRTTPALTPLVMSFLGQVIGDETGRQLLAAQLGSGPPWRKAFFNALPRIAPSTDASQALLVAVARTPEPPSSAELAPYLDDRIAKGEIDVAYNAWLQLLDPDALSKLGILNNPSFETTPSGLAFDWRIGPGQNAVAEIVPLPDLAGARVLHVRFGTGRVRMSEVSQVLLLPQGRYRLIGRLRGTVTGRRGLRWRVTCLGADRVKLGETEMLLGSTQTWRTFTLEFEHDQDPARCTGQLLRLLHDSRSASEELVTGEVWIDDLDLKRIGDATPREPAPLSQTAAPAQRTAP